MVHNEKRVFFEKIDAPLSALACNCLQLSCLLPGQDSYCAYTSSGDGSNWMERLCLTQQKATATMTLRDMVLPGSHDSASGTIGPWKPFSAAGRTQNFSVGRQLASGVRYLDVRVASATKGRDLLSIWHGCLEGGDFEDVLVEVGDFVRDHPKELIILELVPEYGKKFSAEQRRRCLDRAHELLGGSSTIIPGDQLRDIITNKPFVEVAELPQSVAVLLHGRFFEGDGIGMTEEEITAKYGFVNGGKYLRNPWNNTRDISELLAKNLQTVENHKDDREMLLSNQFVVTPGVGNASDVVNALTGKNSLRPVSHACQLYAPGLLDHYLCRNADKSWNIVALDFNDLCPEISDLLISLNWMHTTTMQVLLASICVNGTNQDVTEKVQRNVCRGCVLFLVDPEVDLSSGADKFSISIAYCLSSSAAGDGRSQYYVATVDVSCDSPVIISPYCTNKSSTQVEVTDDNGSSGVVYRGKMYPSKVAISEEASTATIFEYSIEGSKCSFHTSI
jgi:hypothetical protein